MGGVTVGGLSSGRGGGAPSRAGGRGRADDVRPGLKRSHAVRRWNGRSCPGLAGRFSVCARRGE
jgi:hypothetical protein